jgi:hypothetical protein
MTPAARQILNALEAAGDPGVSLAGLKEAGRVWAPGDDAILRHISDLRDAGYTIHVQDRAARLVLEPDVGRDDSQGTPGFVLDGLITRQRAVVSPSAEPTLFTPKAPSAIDGDVAA